MAKYRANPSIVVKALRIVKSDKATDTGEFTLTLEDGSEFKPDDALVTRMTPAEGDYVVWQADGYVYLNPKTVFESKYILIDEEGEKNAEAIAKKQFDKANWSVVQRLLDQVLKSAEKIGVDITAEVGAILHKAPQ